MSVLSLVAGLFLGVWAFMQRAKPGFKLFSRLVPALLLGSTVMVGAGITATVISLIKTFKATADVSPSEKQALLSHSISQSMNFAVVSVVGFGIFWATVIGSAAFLYWRHLKNKQLPELPSTPGTN